MSNITDKVVVITGASSGIRGKHREASSRTRSKSCIRSAAFEPDRRSGSRNLGYRRQGHGSGRARRRARHRRGHGPRPAAGELGRDRRVDEFGHAPLQSRALPKSAGILRSNRDSPRSRKSSGRAPLMSRLWRHQQNLMQGIWRVAPGGVEPPRADSKSAALSTELRGRRGRR